MPASLVLQVDRLVVTTTHMNRNRRFFIYGIVENNARNQFFQTTEGSISVEQYFQEKYKLALRYPLLPLVTERQGSTGINFYPLEVLYIEPGQRVENKKLAGRLTEKVIQQTRMLPQEMRNHNIRQLVQANLMNGENQYLNSFGVGIISCFFLIPFPYFTI
ncbi:PAZ domain protein [Dictyocaulus viviparus]|uniref:PAZ domain protein n=1 Tax=Dictyocaulus viviparus TaxID=29172 RepID=A0A0D8X5T0_DICVI|nr:PAZ domain protein [Dictyocaulus viviparus]